MALPTSPFVSAKSLFAGKSVLQIIIAGAGGATVVFESRKLDSKVEQEFKMIERPDAKGVMRTVRRVMVKCNESFDYEVDEAKRICTDLFGGAMAGSVDATCQIWAPDPNDTSPNVALKSDIFTCQVAREGDVKFGDGDFTKATIKITSTKAGAVAWVVDGAA